MKSYFAEEFELGLQQPEAVATIRIQVRSELPHSPDRLYGVTGALHGDDFLVPDGSGHWCHFDPTQLTLSDQSPVDLALCCELFKPTVLLEWLCIPILHFGLAAAGFSPLHASGARVPSTNGPIIFSAWSGTGKTNLVLEAMKQGAEYFGDDQVVVSAQGLALPSTRRISVYGYNRALAPNLPKASRLKLALGAAMHSAARRTHGRSAFLVAYAANAFGSVRASASDLGGRSGTTTPVRAHLICHRTGEANEPWVSTLNNTTYEALANAHARVMSYEYVWFQRFLQSWVWATTSEEDPWAQLERQWARNLTNYFEAIPRLGQLNLPGHASASQAAATWNLVNDWLATGPDHR